MSPTQAAEAPDWPPGDSEMARLVREHDWAATPLGPVEGWPQSLRTLVDLMLGSRRMMCLMWGAMAHLVYNAPFAHGLDGDHPRALGRSAFDLRPDLRDLFGPPFRQAIAGEEVVLRDRHLRLARSVGGPRDAWFDLTYTPVRDESGQVAGALVSLAETTERVLLERQRDGAATVLRESEARLSEALRIQTVGVMFWGEGLGLTDMNDAFLRMTGFGREEALGKTWADLTPPEFHPPSLVAIEEVMTRGEATPYEKQCFRKDGSRWWGLFAARRVGAEVVEFVLDVTARREAEERLRETEAQQAFLLKLSDALRPLGDPVEIQFAAARLLAGQVGLDRCGYCEVDGTGEFIAVHRDFCAPGMPSFAGCHRLDAFGPAMACALRRGETVVVGDAATDERVPEEAAVRQAWAAAQTAAAAGAPLIKDGRLTAIMFAHRREPRPWAPAEVSLLQEVAERSWAAVERARAEAALRRSEERFRAIVETATDYAIFTTDAEGRIEAWPKGAQEVFGWTAEEAVGQPVDMTFTPEDRASGAPEAERMAARAAGQAPDLRWHLRKDGSRIFIDGITRPLRGEGGAVTGFVKVGQDVTERRATEEALRETEARFRQFGDASGDVLWIRDAGTLAFEYVSPAFEEIYGVPIEGVLAGNHVRRWIGLMMPEDRALALDHLRRVRKGEHVLHTFRIRRPDGQVRWVRDTSFPLLGEGGRVQRIGGIGHDATEEVEMQDRLRVLVAELQHRSRNLVAVVQGVTERTLATSETLDDFRARFRARLGALGRVNSLLSRLEQGGRITFDQLLQTELQAHGVLDGEWHGAQVALRGPQGIRLRSATVQTFALAIHELTTNALKHGALSRPEGHLEIEWSLEPGRGGERQLRVDWRESGVPLAAPEGAPIGGATVPRRRGYGRELIERALPYQLKARTSYELTPDGVRCTITLPVSSTLDLAFSSHEGDDA